MRRVLAWIVLPLVLVPCVAMEIADQEEEICERPVCIVLATPKTLTSRTHTVTIVESGCRPGPCNRPPPPPRWEEDTITATVTTVVSGSLNKKEFRGACASWICTNRSAPGFISSDYSWAFSEQGFCAFLGS
jgi:hypothetical protein